MAASKKPHFKLEGQGLRRGNTYNVLAELEETYALATGAQTQKSSSSFMSSSSSSAVRPHGYMHNDYCLVHVDSCLVPDEVAKKREVPNRKKNITTEKDLLQSTHSPNNSPVILLKDDRLLSHINHSVVSIMRVGANCGAKGTAIQSLVFTNRCAAHCLCLVDTASKNQADIQLVLGFVTGDVLVFSCTTEGTLSRVNSSKVKNGPYYGAVSAMASCKLGKEMKRSVATEIFNHSVEHSTIANSGSTKPTAASANGAGCLPEDHFPSEFVIVGFKSGVVQLLSLDVNGAVVVKTSSYLLSSAPNAHLNGTKSIPGRTASIKAISVSPYSSADFNCDVVGSTGARRGPIAALTTSEGRLLVIAAFSLTPLWEVNHRMDSYGTLLCATWGPNGMLFAGGEDDQVHAYILEDEAAALPFHQSGRCCGGVTAAAKVDPGTPAADGNTQPFFSADPQSAKDAKSGLDLSCDFLGASLLSDGAKHESATNLTSCRVQPTWLRPIGALELHQSWVSSLSVLPMPKSYAGGAYYNDFLLVSASHDNSLGLWYYEDERHALPSAALNTLKRKGTLSRMTRQTSSTPFQQSFSRGGDMSTNTSISSSSGMAGLCAAVGKSQGPLPLPFSQPLECTLNLVRCHRDDICTVVHCVPPTYEFSVQATTAATVKVAQSVSPLQTTLLDKAPLPIHSSGGPGRGRSPGGAGLFPPSPPPPDAGLVDGANEHLLITSCIGAVTKVWRTTTTMSEPLRDVGSDGGSFQTPPRFASRAGGGPPTGPGASTGKGGDDIDTPNSTSPVSIGDNIYSPDGNTPQQGSQQGNPPPTGSGMEAPVEPSPAKPKAQAN